MIDPRRIYNLKAWMKTQRQNYKNLILGDDDASQWCADEVERIERHIQTIELLEQGEHLISGADRIEELEAKLAKAVEELELADKEIMDVVNNLDLITVASVFNAMCTIRNTIAELKGQDDG